MELTHLLRHDPKPPAVDLASFHADRVAQYRAYVDGCAALVERVVTAFQPRVGHAKIAPRALVPSPGQKVIRPNGVMQANGIAEFGYVVELDATPPHAVTFFLSVGRRKRKGDREEWFVGHGNDSFPMGDGGQPGELEALFAHVAREIEGSIVDAYPTEVLATGVPKVEAPRHDEPKLEGPRPGDGH